MVVSKPFFSVSSEICSWVKNILRNFKCLHKSTAGTFKRDVCGVLVYLFIFFF